MITGSALGVIKDTGMMARVLVFRFLAVQGGTVSTSCKELITTLVRI